MTVRKTPPVPYLAAEVVNGRLVRVCPECKRAIVERTDEDGIVSNNFTEHYEAEHGEREPERQRCYLLALQHRDDGEPGPGPEALRNVSRLVLKMVGERIPEVDWELVERVEDLSERAPALIGSEVLRGMWQSEGDDPQLRRIRWYRRGEDGLAFTPTRAQLDEWDAASERTRDVRQALIERHRDQLPQFAGKSVEDWERYYTTLTKREDEIAEEFDAARDVATKQFYRGDYRWQSTLGQAIAALAIPEEEVADLRVRTDARIHEAEAMLRSK